MAKNQEAPRTELERDLRVGGFTFKPGSRGYSHALELDLTYKGANAGPIFEFASAVGKDMLTVSADPDSEGDALSFRGKLGEVKLKPAAKAGELPVVELRLRVTSTPEGDVRGIRDLVQLRLDMAQRELPTATFRLELEEPLLPMDGEEAADGG